MAKSSYQPKDPAPLARAVAVWIWILIAFYAADIAALALQVKLLGDVDPAVNVLAQHDLTITRVILLNALLQILTVVVLMVAGVLSLKWIYRANMNAHTLAKGLSNSPPWAIGWFFVPFAALFKPYQAMREAWQASAHPQNWRGYGDPALLRWWWGFFLVSNGFGYVVGRLWNDRTAGALQFSYGALLASDALFLIMHLVFLAVVLQLTKIQVGSLAQNVFEAEAQAV